MRTEIIMLVFPRRIVERRTPPSAEEARLVLRVEFCGTAPPDEGVRGSTIR
jgi:hypothetical protein